MPKGYSKTPRRQLGEPLTLELIESKCIDDAGCWIWQGAFQQNTPRISAGRGKQQLQARRWVAEAMGHKIAGMMVTSKCDNPRCVSPDCVLVMTRKQLQQRTADRLSYHHRPARAAKLSAFQRSRSEFTEENIAFVRLLCERMSQKEVARRLCMNYDHVNKIATYRLWKDYSNPFAGLFTGLAANDSGRKRA